MIDSSTNTLFQLLRLALGNKEECSLPADINWRNLIDLSFDQGVAAIAVDGLQKLCEQYPEMELALDSPELEDLKYEWFWACFENEHSYGEHLKTIGKLATFYGGQSIKMLVLKGYSLSLNYPAPEYRTYGDIDIYLYGKGDFCDTMVWERLGCEVKQNEVCLCFHSFTG